MSVFPLFVILLIVAMFVIGGIVALCLYFNEKKKQQTYGMNGRAYQMDNNQDMNQQE